MKPDYIRAFSGINFKVFNPDINQINIEDIAHALSHLCRYGGHSDIFYSVAQHSLAVSYLVKPENALCGLLHDATEAYLIDLPRPIKYQIQQYRDMEEVLYTIIAKKFDLPNTLPDDVHYFDNFIITEYEWDYFMLKKRISKHKDFYRRFFENKNPQNVKKLFLNRFKYLTEKKLVFEKNHDNNL